MRCVIKSRNRALALLQAQACKAFSFIDTFIKYLRMKLLTSEKLDQDIDQELVQHMEKTVGLKYLNKTKNQSSHPLYLFINQATNKKCILKRLNKTDSEIKVYLEYLPLIKSSFNTLVLPEAVAAFHFGESICLLLPYYEGEHFSHNTNNLKLADDLVEIVLDLSTIDVALIPKDKSAFNYNAFESHFWNNFDKAHALGMVAVDDLEQIKAQCAEVLARGGKNQIMVVSNGDFNPRNVIRLPDGKLVLLDWNGSFVYPLEHMLAYPWLLNWENPAWQKEYASKFEGKLPVDQARLKMHLMNAALFKAVDEKKHGNRYADKMSADHLKKFYASFSGFQSLTEL